MKRLLLVRHAKSSWDSDALTDFDRPLNKRGMSNAPEMAERLLDSNIKLELIVSSPAQRAISTAHAFANVLHVNPENVICHSPLYEAEVMTFYETICQLDDKYNTVALFAHNPGITDFVNTLGLEFIENIPTCGVVSISVDIEKWSDFETASKKNDFFDFPKNKQ